MRWALTLVTRTNDTPDAFIEAAAIFALVALVLLVAGGLVENNL
jgi:hypothetical protein